jgi:uncharacterized lipoprotein YbaY
VGDDEEGVVKRSTDRRVILMAVGAAAVSAVAGPVVARSTEIGGAVTFEGGAMIPAGQLEITLDDPAIQDRARRRATRTRIESVGTSRVIAFSLFTPAGSNASPTGRIVARLERADGWLVARGSAHIEVGSPVHVMLNAVLY